jgi:hypothetical protein
VGKKWLFWFCPCVGLCGWGKSKCAICAVAEFQNILCGGEKIKYEALGCRVEKSPLLSLYVVLSF